MAQQVINIGNAANDGTGTPNREAWSMVNAMFAEIYAALATFVLTGDYTASITAINASIVNLTAQLGGKADSASVVAKADKAQVVLLDTAQNLNPNQKMQAADNAGSYASLFFEVLPDNLELGGDELVYKLPKIPNNFILKDARLLVDSLPDGEGASYTATVSYGDAAVPVASVVDYGLLNDLTVPLALAGPLVQLPGKTPWRVTVSAAPTGTRTGFGLSLWLRGIWLN
jgi:hypothetical protein